ncbi:MAG: adenosylcobinamide-GDP ribazoletransferase [Ruminococcus sp.]
MQCCSALAVLSGILITGGIHLDGFCDTADALYSDGPRKKNGTERLTGPFAVFSTLRCWSA